MNNKVNFNFIEPELTEPDVNTLQPASYIRKEFVVSGNAKKAMLHITALGVYNAFLNGAAVGNQLLTPGYTNYFKRIQYQTYDVTEMISEGTNAIGVILGDGWYRGCLGMTSKRGYYGRKTALAAVLEIETDQERILTVSYTHLIGRPHPRERAYRGHAFKGDCTRKIQGDPFWNRACGF